MLIQPCPGGPASQYRVGNLQLFRDGRISHNKPMPADDLSYSDSVRSAECPVSDFGQQLINDHPSITTHEARDITRNFLRCAAHAASFAVVRLQLTLCSRVKLFLRVALLATAVNLRSALTNMVEFFKIANSIFQVNELRLVKNPRRFDLNTIFLLAPVIVHLEKGWTG